MVHKARGRKNMQQHGIGYEWFHIKVDNHQRTVKSTAGVCRALHDQFLATHNGEPPWSTEAFFRTVREIGHCDVLSSGIMEDEVWYKSPQEWTKRALNTVEEAMELYMVQVIAESQI